jgi:uncharacterized membrane protein YbhN (UPF0104 family)
MDLGRSAGSVLAPGLKCTAMHYVGYLVNHNTGFVLSIIQLGEYGLLLRRYTLVPLCTILHLSADHSPMLLRCYFGALSLIAPSEY